MSRQLLSIAVSAILLGRFVPEAAAQAQPEPEPPITEAPTDGKGLRILAGRPLLKINVDGTGLQPITRSPDRAFGSPDFSPDGKLIACDTWRIGQGYENSKVLVMRVDGSQMREVGAGAMPSWSPDGTQLVCHTYENPQTIVTMNADGTGRETILDHWGSPRWSPKGNRIASIGESRTIALFDLTTGKERAIFHGPYSLWQGFSISPDGLRFCFGDSRGGVGVATLDEPSMQASVRWLVRNGVSYNSSWAPDGRRIVFSWLRPNSKVFQLYLVDVDANAQPVRLPGQDPARDNTDCDWSPDGNTIIFSSAAAMVRDQ
jgi:Tol biopolymer transport system component